MLVAVYLDKGAKLYTLHLFTASYTEIAWLYVAFQSYTITLVLTASGWIPAKCYCEKSELEAFRVVHILSGSYLFNSVGTVLHHIR